MTLDTTHARLPDDVSSKITSQEKVLWEPDSKPRMGNHPPRVTDSNTRISLSEGAFNGPYPRDDNGLGWVQMQRKSLLWEEKIEGFSIITSEGLITRMDYYSWNVEHPSYEVGSDHGHTDEDSRIMQNPISPGKCRRLHPNETHPPNN
jgi:hypothetical protein